MRPAITSCPPIRSNFLDRCGCRQQLVSTHPGRIQLSLSPSQASFPMAGKETSRGQSQSACVYVEKRWITTRGWTRVGWHMQRGNIQFGSGFAQVWFVHWHHGMRWTCLFQLSVSSFRPVIWCHDCYCPCLLRITFVTTVDAIGYCLIGSCLEVSIVRSGTSLCRT